MSDIDTNSPADGEQEVAAAPKLMFWGRLFFRIFFWSTYAVFAIAIASEYSFLNSASFVSLGFGWVLLGLITIISLGLWRFLTRGRNRIRFFCLCIHRVCGGSLR